jgi:hypothetical protein
MIAGCPPLLLERWRGGDLGQSPADKETNKNLTHPLNSIVWLLTSLAISSVLLLTSSNYQQEEQKRSSSSSKKNRILFSFPLVALKKNRAILFGKKEQNASDLGREERRLEQRESGWGRRRRQRLQQRHPQLPHGRRRRGRRHRRGLRRLLERLGAAPEFGRGRVAAAAAATAAPLGGEETAGAGAGVAGAALLGLGGDGVVVVALDGRAQRPPPPRPHLSFFRCCDCLLEKRRNWRRGRWRRFCSVLPAFSPPSLSLSLSLIVLAPHGAMPRESCPPPEKKKDSSLARSATSHLLHHNLSTTVVLSSALLTDPGRKRERG